MSKSQKELESMVENQKKQLTRYETRLKGKQRKKTPTKTVQLI